MASETVGGVAGVALAGADAMAATVGCTKGLADCVDKDISELLQSENPAKLFFQLTHIEDIKKKPIKTRSAGVAVQVHWEPPQHDVDTDQISRVAVASPADTSPGLDVEHIKNETVVYESVMGAQLLKSELLPRHKVSVKPNQNRSVPLISLRSHLILDGWILGCNGGML